MKIGPRGMNGASPFMNAQPERDIDSTPPASPTARSPERMAWAIWIVQVKDDAQKRLTVAAGTESGKPAASAAQRAMSPIPSCAGFTQPAAMSSIRSRSTPTRSQAQTIACPSRSSVRMCDSEPPYRPTGVRTPPRTKASVIAGPPELRNDVGGERLDLSGRGIDRPEHECVEAVVLEARDRFDPPVRRAGEWLAREI